MGADVFFDSSSELARLTNTFDVAGTPTNPTSVTLTITDPNGNITTPSPANPSTGLYTVDVVCDEPGEWQYLWEGTGTASDAQAGTWTVLETSLGKLYCPIRTLKSRLGIKHNDADYELHQACFTVSRWIEEYTERTFWRTDSATARTFTPTDLYRLKLPEWCELVSVATVKTDTARDGTFALTWSASDYQLLPYNPDAAPERRPYDTIEAVGAHTFPSCSGSGQRRNTVQVTGVWGWPRVPHGVRQAAAILAADTFALKDATFGITGNGEFNMRIGDNRRALQFLAPYRRNAVLVA